MKTRMMFALAALVAAAFVAGCSEMPTQQVQDAEAALQAVEGAGAAQYAPEELTAVNEAMGKLKAELAVQADKPSLLRRYGTATELALAVRQTADAALTEVEAAKQRAHDAAQARIEAAAGLLEVVRPMLANAPRGKGSEADLKLLEADLMGVETTLVAAREALAAGDLVAADARATAAETSLGDIKAAIEAAQALQAQKAGR
ncbi:MAG: hypothetical protein IH621_18360 [Krumholzibacteria bacterium]|nr:hypothetical protein [Candidatus Krumholzibacteria bacterium]